MQQWIAAKLELERLRKTYNATAVDLQKSLDDREAKAGEIQESFDDFKREIIKVCGTSSQHGFAEEPNVYDPGALGPYWTCTSQLLTRACAGASSQAAENSRTGKKIPLKLIEQFEADGRQKNEEVERMRITDIKLRMTLRKVRASERT